MTWTTPRTTGLYWTMVTCEKQYKTREGGTGSMSVQV